MVDPRTTRLSRQQATKRFEDQGTSKNGGIVNTVPYLSDEQGILTSGYCIEPVSSGLQPTFFSHSLSACPPDILESQSGGNVHYQLETGAVVDDAMYYSDVYDVACTMEPCNKRISCAGPEWSAGRPGNRPIGARDVARNTKTCLGPYATRSAVQPHTGCNTRDSRQASSRLPRPEDQSTNQPTTSSSRRFSAAEDRASTATVALQPRRPPYFCGGVDDDVYVWTSIINRWLGTIQGEPSMQLTFVVSLLRGAAYEWYVHYETRIGCPGDWTTLRIAMLERFGSSIRAEKARAGLRQLKQDNMTVLQYANAFESYLARLGEYDESYYLTHFIFGLRPEVMRGVYIQQPESLLAAKNMAEKLELTHLMTSEHQKHTRKEKTNKAAQHRGTQERRSGRRRQSVQDRAQKKTCRV